MAERERSNSPPRIGMNTSPGIWTANDDEQARDRYSRSKQRSEKTDVAQTASPLEPGLAYLAGGGAVRHEPGRQRGQPSFLSFAG